VLRGAASGGTPNPREPARRLENAPGTKVVPGSGVDAHNNVERYAWKIVDRAGN
jgi:predicted TIM-barrel enzyme